MLERIRTLCEEVERQWSAQNNAQQSFAELAHRGLVNARLHEGFDRDAIVRFCFDHAPRPTQIDPSMQYGQPPITMWHNGRFALDIYFFTSPEGVIHDHGFAGAFTNLVGQSLHCTYKYTASAGPQTKVYRGTLSHLQTEVLSPGDVREIHPSATPGASGVHRIWHLTHPMVVSVMRMDIKGANTYEYYENGIALRGLNLDMGFFQKRSRMLRYLFETDLRAANRLAAELFSGSDPWLSFHYLFPYYALLVQSEGSDAAWTQMHKIVELIEKQHGAFISPVSELLNIFDRYHAIEWHRLCKEEQRLLVALLRTYSRRQPIDAWIERFYPGRDSSAAIAEWLSQMVAAETLSLEISSEHLAVLEPLLRGMPHHEIGAALAQAGKPVPENLEAICREVRETSLLLPLFDFTRDATAVAKSG